MFGMTRNISRASGTLQRTPRHRGFTLSEVVIASALLIMAMVPILKGLTGAHLTSTIIERRSQCLILARGKLDEVSVKSIYGYDNSFSESNSSLAGNYICNINDTPVSSNLRSISVEVGYDIDGSGTLSSGETSVGLETYIARR